MVTTLRQLHGEEMLEAMFTLNSYAFHSSPPIYDKEEWMTIVRGRQGMNCYGVFDDNKPASVSVSTPMTQNIRGKLFPVAGVWGVSTFPSARRQGYCRQTMAAVLATDRDAGKVFSNLYPFRESFYERLGYVAFPLTKIARFTTNNLARLLKMDLQGVIKLQMTDEAYETYRSYLTGMRLQKHGMAFFDFGNLADFSRRPSWAALAEFEGRIEGIMLYRILGEEVSKFNLTVPRFYYQTSRARYLMLNWIARHVDQAENVEIWLTQDEFPETWLADTQMKIESSIRPAMCRVLDVGGMGGMEVGEGSFSARITDSLCPWNEGIWRFASSGGRLDVSAVEKADCELSIQGLMALVAGTHDPEDLIYRSWGDPDGTIQTVLRRMFPRMSPYMHEYF
jgi:predicted acetyltransferase